MAALHRTPTSRREGDDDEDDEEDDDEDSEDSHNQAMRMFCGLKDDEKQKCKNKNNPKNKSHTTQ